VPIFSTRWTLRGTFVSPLVLVRHEHPFGEFRSIKQPEAALHPTQRIEPAAPPIEATSDAVPWHVSWLRLAPGANPHASRTH